MKISFKIVLGTLFALLVTAIGILSAISYQNNKASNRTADMVTLTHKVLDKMEELSSIFKEIQLESNAFLITGDTALIPSYDSARNSLWTSLTNLKMLTANNPWQQGNVDSLDSLFRQLLTVTDSSLNVSMQYRRTGESLKRTISINTAMRAQISSWIDRMRAREIDLLTVRVKENERTIAAFDTAFVSLLAGVAFLLGATFFTVRYNFNKRISAQEALQSANERFEKLFYESPVGIAISHVHSGKIIDCNSVYAEMINYRRDEIIGKTGVELGIFKDWRQRDETVKMAISKGIDRDIELQLTPRDKDPIWVSISIQSIRIGEANCLMSVLLDTTVHKKAEEDIKKALASEIELNKLKSNFVTLASHEFRTPLTTILSSAFLLENYAGSENKDKMLKHIARIRSSVNNLTSILDEFLSLTKIEEGKIIPKFEAFEIKDYVEGICSSLQSLAKPGQRIVYEHSGEGEIITDPVLFGNIINNLVSNSIKYSPENSIIQVYSHINDQVFVSVRDSGIGIPEEDQKHLFDRFYRASNVGNVQGTGLGLHIMKHYVNMLDGEIEVESKPGFGSEFRVKFRQSREVFTR